MSQVNFTEVRQWLKQYGYLPNVPMASLHKLDAKSADVTVAAMKMQLLYGEDVLGQPDGIIGDRTIAAILLPRCGHPDYHDDPELPRKAMEAGSGSWPASCHEVAIKVSLDPTSSPHEF